MSGLKVASLKLCIHKMKNSLTLLLLKKEGGSKLKINKISYNQICCGTLSNGLLLKFAVHDFLSKNK